VSVVAAETETEAERRRMARIEKRIVREKKPSTSRRVPPKLLFFV
jgi:hypothetical protein